MGRVRPAFIKRAARRLLEQHSERFTADFERNREVLEGLLGTESKTLKNKIAGYITSLLKQKKEG